MSPDAKRVVAVTGAFDNLKSQDIRFLEEASKLGRVTVLLWGDDAICRLEGKPPQFPEQERLYLLQGIRYVDQVRLVNANVQRDTLPQPRALRPDLWVVHECDDNPARRSGAASRGLPYRVVTRKELEGFPGNVTDLAAPAPGRKKVIATGCYDWLHSGHVRFFEQLSRYGDLYVTVGHDANVRLLKGEGRPLFPQEERRYLVGSIRFVWQALISTGHGWLDAEPEIQRLKPDIYAVNADGDVPEKRQYCAAHGIEYLVLKRTPAPGLPKRSSTELRGF